MKNKKYQTIRHAPKSNRQIIKTINLLKFQQETRIATLKLYNNVYTNKTKL